MTSNVGSERIAFMYVGLAQEKEESGRRLIRTICKSDNFTFEIVW